MTTLIKRFFVAIIMSILIGLGSASAASTEQGEKNTAGFAGDYTKILRDLNNPVNAGGGFVKFDEAAMLAGVWRMCWNNGICQVQDEMIYQSNGTFSAFSQCLDKPYAVRTVGNWWVVQ